MIETITNIDLGILKFIHDYLHFPVLNEIMWFITHLAASYIAPIYPVVLILIGTAIYMKRRRAGTLDESFRPKFDFARLGWMMGVALLFGLIICNFTLKPLIARPRPYTVEGFEYLRMYEIESEKSFPSGHSVAAFEIAFSVAFATRGRGKKWGIIAYVCAVLIAYSRLYVGVHYPTDVLAGAVIGTVCGILGCLAVDKVYKKFIEKRIYKPKQ